MEDKLLGNNVSRLVKSFYEKNNFQFLGSGISFDDGVFYYFNGIYNRYKNFMPFKYDTVKFIAILTFINSCIRRYILWLS